MSKNTCSRGVEHEMKEAHLTWRTMETAQDRAQWRQLVGGPCSTTKACEGISQVKLILLLFNLKNTLQCDK